jgi:hypothetical protein
MQHNAAHLISLTINWTINGWEKPEIVPTIDSYYGLVLLMIEISQMIID